MVTGKISKITREKKTLNNQTGYKNSGPNKGLKEYKKRITNDTKDTNYQTGRVSGEGNCKTTTTKPSNLKNDVT